MIEIKCTGSDTIDIDQLTEFQGALKERDAGDVEKIIKSIKKHGFSFPFFVWAHAGENGAYINHVLDGHGRLMALKKLRAQGEEIPELPCVYVSAKNEAEAKELLLKLNSQYGHMTAESVRDFIKELEIAFDDICLPCGTIDLTPLDKKKMDDTKKTLRQQFLVPPFSVLDTRQGYWQDRKKQWKSIGIKSEEGRDNKMLKHLKENASKVNGGAENTLSEVSIFDPVLCETMYTWFCMPHGSVLDPFAGGSVRGIVASYKHMKYTGFDIRPEQVEANEKQKVICDGNEYAPQWICKDSAKMGEVLGGGEMYDFVFSCPPYADLEKYSDIDGDISNMDYPQFLETYRAIIKAAVSHLKDNRFAVFVVGEVRNKKTGAYYNFIPDTIKAFEDAGLKYYNELILLNVAGGKAYTAGHDAKKSRKIAKVHQNILAFVKGDSKETNADLGDFRADNCILPEMFE